MPSRSNRSTRAVIFYSGWAANRLILLLRQKPFAERPKTKCELISSATMQCEKQITINHHSLRFCCFVVKNQFISACAAMAKHRRRDIVWRDQINWKVIISPLTTEMANTVINIGCNQFVVIIHCALVEHVFGTRHQLMVATTRAVTSFLGSSAHLVLIRKLHCRFRCVCVYVCRPVLINGAIHPKNYQRWTHPVT